MFVLCLYVADYHSIVLLFFISFHFLTYPSIITLLLVSFTLLCGLSFTTYTIYALCVLYCSLLFVSLFICYSL